MTQRLNHMEAAPDAIRAVYALETYVSKDAGLDPKLIHLVKLRASQINGCAYCVDMHVKESRKDGLSEQWIALVCVWREASVFTPKERALLAWVEAVMAIRNGPVPDDIYAAMTDHFSPEEIVRLTVAISTINAWNQMSVAFGVTNPLDNAA